MQVHRLVSLLCSIKTTATWKTAIESMQSLRMDNFRVVYTRFLVFLFWQFFWAIRDGETLVKWPGRASFATHPWNETGWPPKLLARFSS